MKDLLKLNISYMGYELPETDGEVEIEILGLESAVYAIKHRIYMLKQSASIAKHAIKDRETRNEEAVAEANAKEDQSKA